MRWIYCIVACFIVPYARSAYLRTKPGDAGYDDDDPYNLPPPPFSEPGLVFADYTMSDLIPIAADLWNNDNVIDAGRRACEQLKQDVSIYLSNSRFVADIGTVETMCNLFESGNVKEECGNLWDMLVEAGNRPDLINGSVSLIPDLDCLRWDGPGLRYPSRRRDNRVDLSDFDAQNIYHPCSESGIEKINNILFALIDWFGSSALLFAQSEGTEPYSYCDIMRFISSENIADLPRRIIDVMKYPMADILEELRSFDICSVCRLYETGAEEIGAIKDLLLELSNLGEAEMCGFITFPQSRGSYLEQGETIISSILGLRHDVQSCKNVLGIIAPYIDIRDFLQITGYDPREESDRNELCTLLVEAYDPSSTYTPTPYDAPEDGWIRPFDDPGVVYPGFTFIDLVRLDGIAGRGPKVLDAVVDVYCTEVFQSVIHLLITHPYFDIRVVCALLRNGDIGTVESICVANHTSFREFYSENRPLWLRPFVKVNEGIHILHKLTGIMDISREEVCSAAEVLVNGGSIANLTEQVLGIFLTDALPLAHSVCENGEEVMCRSRPDCLVPRTSSPLSTPLHPPRSPSPDDEFLNAERDRKLFVVASVFSLAANFESPEATCAYIARAIDPLSGRANVVYAEYISKQIVGLLTNVDRCSQIIDTALEYFNEEEVSDIFPVNEINGVVPQLTGFGNSRDFCQAVAESFATRPSGTTLTPPISSQAYIARAIDPLSGQANEVYAEYMSKQIMGLLTNVDRCTQIIDTALDYYNKEEVSYIPVEEINSVISQLTGFGKSRDFCQAVAESFASGPSGTTPTPPIPGPGGELVAKITAEVVIRIQRAAKST